MPEREGWNLTRVGSWGMLAGQDLSMCEGMLYIFRNYDLESLHGERAAALRFTERIRGSNGYSCCNIIREDVEV